MNLRVRKLYIMSSDKTFELKISVLIQNSISAALLLCPRSGSILRRLFRQAQNDSRYSECHKKRGLEASYVGYIFSSNDRLTVTSRENENKERSFFSILPMNPFVQGP